MSAHWRLAAWYSLASLVPAGAAAAWMGIGYSEAHAVALLYGVAVGLFSFVSTAATVSMITARSAVIKALGAASFAGRYLFVVLALGLPAYLELWPATAMFGGFAGVYLGENVVLLPRVLGAMTRGSRGKRAREKEERKVAT